MHNFTTTHHMYYLSYLCTLHKLTTNTHTDGMMEQYMGIIIMRQRIMYIVGGQRCPKKFKRKQNKQTTTKQYKQIQQKLKI